MSVDSRNDEPEPPSRWELVPIELPTADRGWIGIIGLTLLLSGTIATFMGHDGLAALALILVGFVCGIASYTGKLPSYMKIGDNVVAYARQVERGVDTYTALMGTDTDTIKEAAQKMLSAAPDGSPEALIGARALDQVAFQDEIQRVLGDITSEAELPPFDSNPHLGDYEIRLGDSAVSIQASLRIDTLILQDIAARLRGRLGPLSIIVVYRDEESGAISSFSDTANLLRESHNHYYTYMRWSGDWSNLRQTIGRLLCES